jgi:hypothetical protein
VNGEGEMRKNRSDRESVYIACLKNGDSNATALVTDSHPTFSRMSAPLVRMLGHSALRQRPDYNVILSSTSTVGARRLFTSTPASCNFRTSLSVWQKPAFRSPHSKKFSILQFTQSAPWKATHLDRRPRPTGRDQKSSNRGSWIDDLPPSTIFWSIFAANAGVFVCWYYAKYNYVGHCISHITMFFKQYT